MAGRGGRHSTAGGAPITGQVGTPPPPGAPIETAQPLSPAAVADAVRKASVNATELPAFAPKGDVTPAVARAREVDALNASARRQRPPVAPSAPGAIILTDAPPVVDPLAALADKPTILQSMGQAVLAAQAAVDASEPTAVAPPLHAPAPEPNNAATDAAAPPVVDAPGPPPVTADQILDPPPALEPHHAVNSKLGEAARNLLSSRARTAQPAASNTDSPSRGVPNAVADPGKRITGGFGESMDQQYFPLDGNELREVILGLMDKLVAQLQNDLRFSMAMVYPRVSATVSVNVVGYTHETDFTIPKRAEHLRTSPEVCEAVGAVPVEITLENNIAEFSEDGQSLTPPNTMRRELGLQVPKKQRVAIPTGYAVVDKLT